MLFIDLLFTLKKIKKKKVTEVQRGDLVGQYLGATEGKCADVLKAARGGVLFIDEAYRLTPRSESDYGRIAINQLMSAMEKGDPVMIFAGYKNEMSSFVKVNPGLKSRIRYYFDFPDYSLEELEQIMLNKISDSGYRYEGKKIAQILGDYTSQEIRQEQNARLITNLLSEAVVNLSSRLSLTSEGPGLVTITDQDIQNACEMLVGTAPQQPISGGDEEEEDKSEEARNSPTY